MTSKPTRGCSFLSEGGFTLIRTAISHRLERQHRGGLFKAGKPSAGVFKQRTDSASDVAGGGPALSSGTASYRRWLPQQSCGYSTFSSRLRWGVGRDVGGEGKDPREHGKDSAAALGMGVGEGS